MSEKIFTSKEIKSFIENDSIKLPITMKLKKPFDFAGEQVESITFEREPIAGDIEMLPIGNQTTGDSFRILSKITGWELPRIKHLRMVDLQNASGVLQYFLGDSEEDGEQD